jgi:hypothetical protein
MRSIAMSTERLFLDPGCGVAAFDLTYRLENGVI